MKQIQIFAVTFPSFTVNCNDVCGIGSHPLPHTCCIFQHVPETDSPSQLQTLFYEKCYFVVHLVCACVYDSLQKCFQLVHVSTT